MSSLNPARTFEQVLTSTDEPEGRTLVDALISDAAAAKASDIHVDPLPKAYRIRFRIDGVLRQVALAPPAVGKTVARAFQVAAEIDQVSARPSFDGRMNVPVESTVRDIRVATAPGLSGDKITARLLHRSDAGYKLENLGLASEDLHTIREVLGRQTGMVIVSGPTGSGKTTTAYALLDEILKKEVNVITLEDPIEFQLANATQIEVTDDDGHFSFADGVRTLLRHDPDCLFLGEVRDSPTALNAVEASFSGHGLITTIHARHCVATVMMLRSMGVPNHFLASALQLVINQRLARRLCDRCKDERNLTTQEEDLIQILGYEPPERLFVSIGCSACSNTGFRGRFPLFELWQIDEAAYQAILRGADENEMQALLKDQRPQGGLDAGGFAAVTRGDTSLAEWRSIAR